MKTLRMESLQTLHTNQQIGKKRVTVVQYDLMSSDAEMEDDQSYIYCSATKLSLPCPESSDDEKTSETSSQDNDNESS